MTHVTHLLQRWLGDELDPAAARDVQAHLETCADCRAEAAALRGVWTALGEVEPAAASGSVWPAVRARTTGARPAWFFGGGPLVRTGLAAAAVAAGLLAAVLLPAGGEKSANDGTLYAMSSRVLDEDAVSTLDVWMAAGAETGEVTR